MDLESTLADVLDRGLEGLVLKDPSVNSILNMSLSFCLYI